MDRRFRRSIAPVLLAVAVAAPTAPAPAQQAPEALPRPCEDDARRQELDFWLGTWRVVGADGSAEGREVGRSRIETRHGGCVIVERWRSSRGGGSGQGLSYVDPADGRWRQVWVGSTGTVVRYEGERRGGAVRFQGRVTSADGTERLSRAVLEPLPDGRVRQRIERSDDGGATWTEYFHGIYEPVEGAAVPQPDEGRPSTPAPAPRPAPAPPLPAPEPAPAAPLPEPPPPAPAPAPEPAAPAPMPRAAEPAPAPPPAPAPAPAPGGGVTAVSGEVPDEEIPPAERETIRLVSPMVLEVPVGPVEAIPEGYSWSTDETTRYVVEETTIRKVTLARSERRNRVELEVTAALHCRRFLEHADLGVELVSGGEVVAEGRLEDFPVGRSVKAQAQGDGLEKTVVLEMDRAAFQEAFTGEERPVLRLSLAVRD